MLYPITVKPVTQPAGYTGFRGFWGHVIVEGAGFLPSNITEKRTISRKNGKCGLYSRAGSVTGYTVDDYIYSFCKFDEIFWYVAQEFKLEKFFG